MKNRQQAVHELLKAIPSFESMVSEQIELFLERVPKAKFPQPWCLDDPQRRGDAITRMVGIAEFLKGCREDIFREACPSPSLQKHPFLYTLEEAIRKLIKQCYVIPFNVWMIYENTLLCFTLLQKELSDCEND